MTERIRKATAIVLRKASGGWETLVFGHPLEQGGVMVQLPGGTVEPEEMPEAAATRELLEETGVQASDPSLAAILDELFEAEERTRWIYVFAAPADLPAEWASICDCGVAIRCHWLPLDQAVVVDHQQPWLDAARDFVRALRVYAE